VTECYAMAIGGRSQSARTYLEKHLKDFPTSNLDELIKHSLLALRDTIPAEENLSATNTSIAYVGVDSKLVMLEDELVKPYLDGIADVPRARLPGAQIRRDDDDLAPPDDEMRDAGPQVAVDVADQPAPGVDQQP